MRNNGYFTLFYRHGSFSTLQAIISNKWKPAFLRNNTIMDDMNIRLLRKENSFVYFDLNEQERMNESM